MALLAELTDIKTRIDGNGRATREDIYEALGIIQDLAAEPTDQVRELCAAVYSGDDMEKLLSSLDSYEL